MDSRQLIFHEIFKINDFDVRNFAVNAFHEVDSLFWDSPCSSSGKYHPPEDNGVGGLVRHLIKASYVAEQFARKHNFTSYELDLARTATILHDICKNGNPWGENTDYRHGIIGAKYLEKFSLEDKTAKQIILDGVRYHMVPWNTSFSPDKYFLLTNKGAKSEENVSISVSDIKNELDEVKRGLMPHHIIETCVQQADYWSSREGMSFFPGININLSERHD